MRDRRGWDRTYENQSTPLQSRADGARHVSVQIAAKIAKIHRIRSREIALVSSTLVLPLCTYPQNCKMLATRSSTPNGSYSPGFDTCRSSLRPWRASVQEKFCKAANVAVLIIERRKELLVRGQVQFGAPLQMASK